MALPGPAQNPNKVGRTPNAEWVEVENVPFLKGRERELPARAIPETDEDGKTLFTEGGWSTATARWWDVVRTLPHAAIWTEADWMFAEDTAYLKENFYTGSATAAEMTEMRRREDLMGLSAEARRKNRIRYRAPREATPAATETSSEGGTVTPMTRGRRRRDIPEV